MTIVEETPTRLDEVLMECQRTCDACVYDCCAEAGQSEGAQTCLDCSPICTGCVKLASSNPEWGPQLCKLCGELTQACTAGHNGGRGHGCIRDRLHCAEQCYAAAA